MTPREAAPDAGQVRSLGLLDAKAAEINIDRGKLLPTKADNLPRS